MSSMHSDFNTKTNPELESEITEIIADLSLEEKVWMMSGHGFFKVFLGEDNRQFGRRTYAAGSGCERLDIPPLYFTDGPRGVRHIIPTTSFPVSMARGASWDTDLERRIGNVIGIEERAVGATLSGAVCVNLLRHPAWGRAQETYGEDPYLLGELGAALSEGIQEHNVISTVKHFALNSIENSRFKVNVKATERVMREVYLPHFKRIVDSGCASVMSAYNKVNGDYCGHSKHLLRDILKDEWGFKGFVHSDWVKGAYGPDAAEAGLDIENPDPIFFGETLVNAVNKGDVSMESIDDAVRRILRTQMTFDRAEDPRVYSKADVACELHTSLAREAAEKSFVLLKNDDLLPLDKSRVKKIACFGKLMDTANLGDKGSSCNTPPYAVTLLEGLKNHASDTLEIEFYDGDDLDEAKALASSADACIIAAGYTWEHEGEYIPGNEAMEGLEEGKNMMSRGGDRSDLRLLETDREMISAICAANSHTVVAVMAGSAVIMEDWKADPEAILMVWYPGMEGGSAFARTIFGDVTPSGKLPFTIPESADDLPYFDASVLEIEYGLYHGYTLLSKSGVEPAFPFGFGLSYTSFAFSNLRKAKGQDGCAFEIDVTNTGDRAGDEVVQCYVGFENSEIDRPGFLLRGFKRIHLEAGETKTVSFEITSDDLMYYDEAHGEWAIEDIPYLVRIGSDSLASRQNTMPFHLNEIRD
ncbi:MAG: glycosyl hydrolase [Ponticaulis sp.]|nr:glycosyl hydrolase [Ponticaulis sp.]